MEAFRQRATAAATRMSGALSAASQKAVEAAARMSSTLLNKYQVEEEAMASGGHRRGVWVVHRAIAVKTGERCSVWLVDKKRYTSDPRYAKNAAFKQAVNALLELARREAGMLAKLRHPCVVRLLESLDETQTHLMLVTEPVAATLANVTGDAEHLGQRAAAAMQALDFSVPEALAGTLQLAEGCAFLHQAGLLHRGINPAACVITEDGSWKLGVGFALAKNAADADPCPEAFAFPSHDDDNGDAPCARADLGSTAPELAERRGASAPAVAAVTAAVPTLLDLNEPAGGHGAPVPGGALPAEAAADIFSLGTVVFAALSAAAKSNERALIPCIGNAVTYRRMLLEAPNANGGAGARLHEIRAVLGRAGNPMDAVERMFDLLSAMLAPMPTVRPAAAMLSRHPAFSADPVVASLTKLDKLIEMDAPQKVAFLKSMGGILARLGARVKRQRVLPPLLTELRNPQMQAVVLPLIMEIGIDRGEFTAAFGPYLAELAANAAGETLLLLCTSAPRLVEVLTGDAVDSYLIPLLRRGCTETDTRVHIAVLSHLPNLFKGEATKQTYAQIRELLPHVQRLATATTNSSVRVHALKSIAALMPMLAREDVDAILAMCQAIASHDDSAATALCVAGVLDAASKVGGAGYTATAVLPVMVPLLASKTIAKGQFQTLHSIVSTALKRVADARFAELEKREEVHRAAAGGTNSTFPHWAAASASGGLGAGGGLGGSGGGGAMASSGFQLDGGGGAGLGGGGAMIGSGAGLGGGGAMMGSGAGLGGGGAMMGSGAGLGGGGAMIGSGAGLGGGGAMMGSGAGLGGGGAMMGSGAGLGGGGATMGSGAGLGGGGATMGSGAGLGGGGAMMGGGGELGATTSTLGVAGGAAVGPGDQLAAVLGDLKPVPPQAPPPTLMGGGAGPSLL